MVNDKTVVKKEASEIKKSSAKAGINSKVVAKKTNVKVFHAVKVAKNTGHATIVIQQVKSAIRKPQDQVDTLIGLGLNKMNRISELEDTPSVRGMVNKVMHLLKILN